MSRSERLSVFVSWSKRYSGKIAIEIKEWIENNIAQVSVFISHEIGAGDKWSRVIDEEMVKADIGILILTPENINSAWVLFESGAIYNTGKILPLLCGREKGKIEGPFQGINYAEFSKEGITKLLEQINTQLGLSMTENGIRNIVSGTWEDLFQKVSPLVKNSRIYIPDPEESGLKNLDQDDVDFAASRLFTVQGQADIEPNDVFDQQNITVGEIPSSFKSYLDVQIPKKYKRRDKQKDGSIQTRFMINDTRISNFVSFTDGKRIALFNRDAANIQQVKNPSPYDVFGAVTFENNSLFLKIKNEQFKQVKIVQMDEIPGFAFEDNINKYLETETVIMFGFSAVVSPTDLDLITVGSNETIKLWNLRSDVPRNTTGKARLAFKYSKNHYRG
jgi:hypothetical protein